MAQFSSRVLLSNDSRVRCVKKLNRLPVLTLGDFKPTQKAAVLVPLCIVDHEVCLLYTLRSLKLKSHSGQVSFPGGKADLGENVRDTALRETEEEIGVNRNDIEIWGEMSGVQGRNNNLLITPVVGVINNFEKKNLKPNIQEVEEVFTVPLKELCNPKNHGHIEFTKYSIPVYMYKQYKIWGITAIITHLFLISFLPSSVYEIGFLNRQFKEEELNHSKL